MRISDIIQEGYYIFPKKSDNLFSIWFLSDQKVKEIQAGDKVYLHKDEKLFEGTMDEVKVYLETHEEIKGIFIDPRYVGPENVAR